MVLRTDGTVVLRPVLGLTAYLADPAFWATTGASRAFAAFLETVPAERLRSFTTSLLTTWEPFQPSRAANVQGALSSWSLVTNQPRHLFFARFADEPNVPELGFGYTEVDPARASRAAVLELTLPFSTPPAQLERLARQLIEIGPLHSLVGAWAARWNVLHQRLAFSQFFLWSRRFIGLDIQDAEEFAWRAPRGIPAINWLTYVSDALLVSGKIDVQTVAMEGARVERLGAGALFTCGPGPDLGDLNRLGLLASYSHLARQLEPLLDPEPPLFWGAFHEGAWTRLWQRRFIDPAGWAGG
jgi:hypothetical protein